LKHGNPKLVVAAEASHEESILSLRASNSGPAREQLGKAGILTNAREICRNQQLSWFPHSWSIAYLVFDRPRRPVTFDSYV